MVRNLAGIRDSSGLHPELHDAAEVATLQQVLEDHVGAARIDGEVDHHFVPLGGNDVDTRLRYGRGLQAALSSDLTERLAAAESKQELASVGAVQEAEAILAALNVHERPGSSVDQDRVAQDALVGGKLRVVARRVVQRPVGIEELGLDNQRHVELAAGQTQTGLMRVV